MTCSTNEKLQVMDLNVECQLLVLDSLNVPALVSIAETSKHFFNLVEDVLKRRFVKKSIIFETPSLINTGEDQVTEEEDNCIKIGSIQVAKKLIKYFGHLIVNVEFNRYPNVNSLDIFPNEFINPLKNVETISLRGQFEALGNSKLKFHEIFPALRKISAPRVSVRDMSWINHKFPFLQYLHVHIWNVYDEPGYFNPLVVGRLTRNNPQIRNLTLENASRQTLSLIATNLRELEVLELRIFNNNHPEDTQSHLYFEKLKILKMSRCTQSSMPNNVTFRALEEFETDGFPRKCKEWIHFIRNNENLKIIRVVQAITNADILQISLTKPNLVHIELICGEDVENQSLIELIKNSNELKKIRITLAFGKPVNATISVLQNQLGYGWIIEGGTDSIILERKIGF